MLKLGNPVSRKNLILNPNPEVLLSPPDVNPHGCFLLSAPVTKYSSCSLVLMVLYVTVEPPPFRIMALQTLHIALPCFRVSTQRTFVEKMVSPSVAHC